MWNLRISRGRCVPLGATAVPDGVNFALLSRHATAVSLVISPLQHHDILTQFPLHTERNRTGDHWHVQVEDLPPTFCYGWRVNGPTGPGHAFDPSLVLLDPWTTALSDGAVWGRSAETNGRGTPRRSLYVRRPFNWHEDTRPRTPLEDSIICELHVRGYTCRSSSDVRHPGTFAGLVEKIPYLQVLGVTAVELLPVHEFDETDCPFLDPRTGEQGNTSKTLGKRRSCFRFGLLR